MSQIKYLKIYQKDLKLDWNKLGWFLIYHMDWAYIKFYNIDKKILVFLFYFIKNLIGLNVELTIIFLFIIYSFIVYFNFIFL